MSVINVSIIISEQTNILENKLVQLDIPLSEEEARIYREKIDVWMQKIPAVGELQEIISETTVQALELERILTPRDPEIFGEYYIDREGDAAMIERRPYNWANL